MEKEDISSETAGTAGTAKTTGKRVRKENICFFCKGAMKRPLRHFQQKHSKEAPVIAIMNIEDPIKKKAATAKLIAAGNWQHNEVVLKTMEGDLVLKKKDSKVVPVEELVPCAYCKQMYRSASLFKHSNRCAENVEKKKGDALHQARQILPLHASGASRKTQEYVLKRLRQDDVREVIMADKFILTMANLLVEGCFSNPNYKNLRARVRAFGRFLLAGRTVTQRPNMSFQELLIDLHEHLLPIMELYTKDFKFYNNTDSLHADLLRAYEELFTSCEADDVEKLWEKARRRFQHKYRIIIRKKITYYKNNSERYRETEIPTQKEFLSLYEFVTKRLQEALKNKDSDDYHDYQELCKYTIVKITMHNYRRGNEVAQMTLENYAHKSKYDPSKYEGVEMGAFEKTLGKAMELVKLKGKSAQHPTVTALLSPMDIQAVEAVLEMRKFHIGSKSRNIHVFATKGYALEHTEGPRSIKSVVEEAGFKKEKCFVATNFRKFCATWLSWKDIPDQQRNVIYEHLGHTERIHKAAYRTNADMAKTTIVPAELFKTIFKIDVPNDITEYEAQELIYQKMAGFYTSDEKFPEEEPTDNLPSTSSDALNEKFPEEEPTDNLRSSSSEETSISPPEAAVIPQHQVSPISHLQTATSSYSADSSTNYQISSKFTVETDITSSCFRAPSPEHQVIPNSTTQTSSISHFEQPSFPYPESSNLPIPISNFTVLPSTAPLFEYPHSLSGIPLSNHLQPLHPLKDFSIILNQLPPCTLTPLLPVSPYSSSSTLSELPIPIPKTPSANNSPAVVGENPITLQTLRKRLFSDRIEDNENPDSGDSSTNEEDCDEYLSNKTAPSPAEQSTMKTPTKAQQNTTQNKFKTRNLETPVKNLTNKTSPSHAKQPTMKTPTKAPQNTTPNKLKKRKLESTVKNLTCTTSPSPAKQSTMKTSTKTKSTPKKNKKRKFESPVKNPSSKSSWPDPIKEILAKEFYWELSEKQPIDGHKLHRVRSQIGKQFPYFTPTTPTIRTFVSCNFKRTKTFGKFMDKARRSLKLD
ncbi:uncharacterized protein LOC135841709 isoform X2 [Planococcus citri]|uniref:uncharacterized protein LOC135841709 isoform X2 n=1 Tax=Planococcus citri TaxID=170843 RepID=UPI0031F9504F